MAGGRVTEPIIVPAADSSATSDKTPPMGDHTARPTRHRDISADAAVLLELGESGRFEFKQDAEAVSPKVLAALANWVALDETREVGHILVGVREVEDPTTGLVYGEPCGLAKGLDKAVMRIQDVASKTRPIPVDAFIIEEGVDTDVPFLRIEIRPTMPPHFDDEGRRQTRQGRSTRALADEELLQIYLSREAGNFAARYREISAALEQAVGAVGHQVDAIASAIDENIARPIAVLTEAAAYAGSAASSAEDAAQTVGNDVIDLERVVRSLHELVEDLLDESPDALASRLFGQRRRVWWNFTVDTWKRTSKQANAIAANLHEMLSDGVSLDASRNAWEIAVWDEILNERRQQPRERGSLKWWHAALGRVVTYLERPAYDGPELPDLRAELLHDVDNALDDPDSLTRQFSALIDRDAE